MYTTQQISSMYQQLAKSLNVDFNTPIKINRRLTRTLGRVISNVKDNKIYPNRIEFSQQLLETATEESINQVLIHEFCHWYLAETTHENHGHDTTFKTLCQNLGGGEGKTTTDIQYKVDTNEIYKYQCYCEKCGKEVAHYSRASRTTQHPELFYSSCCRSTLKVIQNW